MLLGQWPKANLIVNFLAVLTHIPQFHVFSFARARSLSLYILSFALFNILLTYYIILISICDVVAFFHGSVWDTHEYITQSHAITHETTLLYAIFNFNCNQNELLHHKVYIQSQLKFICPLQSRTQPFNPLTFFHSTWKGTKKIKWNSDSLEQTTRIRRATEIDGKQLIQ